MVFFCRPKTNLYCHLANWGSCLSNRTFSYVWFALRFIYTCIEVVCCVSYTFVCICHECDVDNILDISRFSQFSARPRTSGLVRPPNGTDTEQERTERIPYTQDLYTGGDRKEAAKSLLTQIILDSLLVHICSVLYLYHVQVCF